MIAVDKGFAQTGSGSPERQLWCAVLSQALADAYAKLPRLRKRSDFAVRCDYVEHVRHWRNAVKARTEARRWLTRINNKWRGTVCDFAGICEEALTGRARKLYRVKV